MNQIKILFTVFLLACISSCNNDKMYEGEMYKHVFSLVSSDNFNIRALDHDLDIAEDVAYISVSCGGTTPTDKDVIITLKEDSELFDLYNRSNFAYEDQFAGLVPRNKYTFNSYDLKLPAGEKSANLAFKIKPEGLSPDSTYFISLKVDNFSEYEINANKADVLYRPYLKNFWATQRVASNYRLRGKFNGNDAIGTKRLFPLTHNRVRTTIGNITNFTADTARINTESIVIEVNKARSEKLILGKKYPVTITPYRRGTILPPIAEDPEFPNIFFIEFDGYKTFKTFLLHYQYIPVGGTAIQEMKEELRLEFIFEDN